MVSPCQFSYSQACYAIHLALQIQSSPLFSGGNDVFIDIGDKSWGVLACQRYFGGIARSKTLHIGDQFLSAGSNDFKVCTFFPQYAQPFDNPMLTLLALPTGPPGMHHILGFQSGGNSAVTG